MPPRSLRGVSKKAASAQPEYARFCFLAEAAKLISQLPCFELAAYLGRQALQVATDPAAAAPRKALLQLCASCGIPKHGGTCSSVQLQPVVARRRSRRRSLVPGAPGAASPGPSCPPAAMLVTTCKVCGAVSSQAFTSMTAAEQAFSLYQHHTRGSEPSAAQAGQGSRDDPAAGPAAALSRSPQHQPAAEHAAAQQLIPITSPIPDTASNPASDHGPTSTSNPHVGPGMGSASCPYQGHTLVPAPEVMASDAPAPCLGPMPTQLPEGGPSASLCTPADHCNPMPPPTIFNTMAASPPQADEDGLPDSLPPLTGCHTGPSPPSSAVTGAMGKAGAAAAGGADEGMHTSGLGGEKMTQQALRVDEATPCRVAPSAGMTVENQRQLRVTAKLRLLPLHHPWRRRHMLRQGAAALRIRQSSAPRRSGG
ncbi:hypothetical protein V8C86DRAFT_2473846 [Haematococcus lacustris]